MDNSRLGFAIPCIFVYLFFASATLAADSLTLKLPFSNRQSFTLTRGYNEGTHTGKDQFALDFTQNGCDAYGKDVLAVANGKVKSTKSNDRYYGNEVIIEHTDYNLESVYAHLEKFTVSEGQEVKQGEVIGNIGNTGNVKGNICIDHPGTHLHFAIYQEVKQDNGTIYLSPYQPEPMSGYGNGQAKGSFVDGQWYESDNSAQVEKTEPNPIEQKTNESWWQKIIDFVSRIFKTPNNASITQSLPMDKKTDTEAQGKTEKANISSDSGKAKSDSQNETSTKENQNIEKVSEVAKSKPEKQIAQPISQPIAEGKHDFLCKVTVGAASDISLKYAEHSPRLPVEVSAKIEKDLNEWVKQNLPMSWDYFDGEHPAEIHDFTVIGNSAWAISSYYNFGRHSYILYSFDQGKNWKIQWEEDSPLFSINPYAICFLNEKAGWVGGEEGLLFTQDGGSSWKNFPVPNCVVHDYPVMGGWIDEFQLMSDQHLSISLRNKEACESFDGGKTWQKVDEK